MPTSEAHVRTETPARWVTRLCKHFAHKVPATFTADEGRIEFPMGVGTLTATAGVLTLRAEAEDAEALARVEDVLARHLVRFAEPEALEIQWETAA